MSKTLFFLSLVLISSCTSNPGTETKNAVQQITTPAISERSNDMKQDAEPAPELKPVQRKKAIGTTNGNKSTDAVIRTPVPHIAPLIVLNLMPKPQLDMIHALNSLSLENDSLKNIATKEQYLVSSVTRFNKFITDDLKFEVKNWEGVLRSVTVLEHSAVEVEIFFPAGLDNTPGSLNYRSINFISMVSTSNRSVIDALDMLAEGDKVMFSGKIMPFINNILATRTYEPLTNENVLRSMGIFLELEEIQKIDN